MAIGLKCLEALAVALPPLQEQEGRVNPTLRATLSWLRSPSAGPCDPIRTCRSPRDANSRNYQRSLHSRDLFVPNLTRPSGTHVSLGSFGLSRTRSEGGPSARSATLGNSTTAAHALCDCGTTGQSLGKPRLAVQERVRCQGAPSLVYHRQNCGHLARYYRR